MDSPISRFGTYCRKLVKSPSRNSPQFRRSDSKEMHRVFTYFDQNGDGKISAAELQSRMRTVGGDEHRLSDEEAEMAVRSSDSDGDGMLGFEDFKRLMEAGKEEEKIEELREAFGLYATGSAADSGNSITPKSLKKMLSRLGQPATVKECKAMIGKFDLNGDGVLDFNEFTIMMS